MTLKDLMETVKLTDLNPAPYNPNYMDKTQTQQLSNSIDTWGYLDPIIVNKRNMVVVGGHQRLTKLLQKGVIEEDVVIVDLDQTNEKALNLALNKIKGQFDETKLETLIEDLQIEGFDVELTGFQETELESLFPEEKLPVIEDDYNPEEVEIEAKVQPGDIWILGRHRLLCGDTTNIKNFKLLMDGKNADMLFTDPPYGLGGYGGRNNMELKGDDHSDITKFYDCIPANIPERYIWGNYKNLMRNIKEVPRDVIVWKKNNFGLGKGYRGQYELCFYYGNFNGSDSDVWEVKKDTNYFHPTQKPIELPARAIKNSSSVNDIVLDLFGGSGSTLIACEQLQRHCYMMEIDPHYCDIIINRWEEFTSAKARIN